MKHKLLAMLALGLAIRELLAPWTGHPWDFEVFARVGYYVAHGSSPYVLLDPVQGITFAPWGILTSVGYPPPWPLICGLAYSLYAAINQVITAPSLVYFFLLKQPAIFGDILCAVIASRLVGGKGSRGVLMFWLFNPLIIIISSVWGMFDSIVVLMCLLSLLWLFRNRSSASGAALGLGAALKIIPGLFAPILMLYSKGKLRFAALFAAVGGGAVLLPFLIFGWPPSGFLRAMASQAVNFRDTPSAGGLTVFSIVEPINWLFPGAIPPSLITALSYAWILAFLGFYLKLWWPTLRGWSGRLLGRSAPNVPLQPSVEEVLRLLIIASVLYLLTRVWVSDHHVIYLLAFLVMDVCLFHEDRKKAFTALWVLSLLFLISNNTLLIRFLSPVSADAYWLDLALNNSLATGVIRMGFKVLFGTVFYFVLLRLLLKYLKKSPGPSPSRHAGGFVGAEAGWVKGITVGICAHNERENIGKLLDSLRRQKLGSSFSLSEIIVVSSGSTDGTNEIVRKKAEDFSKISLVAEPERAGKSNAQNVILGRARGDLIVLISADSILRGNALHDLVSAFSGNVGGANAKAVPLGEGKGIVDFASRFIWELLSQTNSALAARGELNALGSDMLAIRSGIVKRIPSQIVNDNAYLGAVVRSKGFDIAYVPEAVLYIRGPATVGDFLRQRSRVIFGHSQISRGYGIRPRVFESLMITNPFMAVPIFIKACSRFGLSGLFKMPFVVALEGISQGMARTGRKRDYMLWDMVSTSKREIPDAAVGLRP